MYSKSLELDNLDQLIPTLDGNFLKDLAPGAYLLKLKDPSIASNPQKSDIVGNFLQNNFAKLSQEERLEIKMEQLSAVMSENYAFCEPVKLNSEELAMLLDLGLDFSDDEDPTDAKLPEMSEEDQQLLMDLESMLPPLPESEDGHCASNPAADEPCDAETIMDSVEVVGDSSEEHPTLPETEVVGHEREVTSEPGKEIPDQPEASNVEKIYLSESGTSADEPIVTLIVECNKRKKKNKKKMNKKRKVSTSENLSSTPPETKAVESKSSTSGEIETIEVDSSSSDDEIPEVKDGAAVAKEVEVIDLFDSSEEEDEKVEKTPKGKKVMKKKKQLTEPVRRSPRLHPANRPLG